MDFSNISFSPTRKAKPTCSNCGSDAHKRSTCPNLPNSEPAYNIPLIKINNILYLSFILQYKHIDKSRSWIVAASAKRLITYCYAQVVN